MLTKDQKIAQIKEAEKLLTENRVLFFIDFTGAGVEDLKSLRMILRNIGAKLKVFKKKLMRIVFERSGINFNPEEFDSQLGIIFSNNEISEVASPVYKFFKEIEKKGSKILGGYDLSAKNFINAEIVIKIGQLPPREVLLAQLAAMLSAPIRMFLYVLNERSRTINK